MDTVKHLAGKLVASSGLARPLKDEASANVKHTNASIDVESFGGGVILWNTVSLSSLLTLHSTCQYQEKTCLESNACPEQYVRGRLRCVKITFLFVPSCKNELIRNKRAWCTDCKVSGLMPQ